ncbi:MAG: 3-methyl-2-oxobutanoate hydroxymethyltransferase [Verrucomicrobia bacterium]|nr:3-methyl-2-oxobutanoate hydroxymethyltransferase [Verrucomicrobiota bacterium]
MTAWTAAKIRAAKGKEKLPCLTGFDFASARLLDEAGIPLILVGDSLAMTVLGYPDTLPVTMDEMLHHTRAVVRGVKQALVVADMPFMSYQASVDEAVANAGRFVKDARAGAVKIEGGAFRKPLIETLVRNGIPVLGHIGLTPQSLREIGGYKVEGRNARAAELLLEDARALEAAGVFAIVLECMPSAVATGITATVGVPTIGIGAGPGCDGQILVSHDVLGLFSGFTPKFVKRYAELGKGMAAAFAAYKQDVQGGAFPAAEHEY